MNAWSPRIVVPGFGLLSLVAACGISDPEPATAVQVARSATGGVSFIAGQLGADRLEIDRVFGVDGSELSLVSTEIDDLGMIHRRYQQSRDGIPVVSGDYRVSRDASGAIVAASGASWDGAPVADTPSIDAATATGAALAATAGGESAGPADLVYVAPSSGASPVLAWRTLVSGRAGQRPVADVVFVDATTGAVVDRHPQIHEARNRETYDMAGGTETGTLARAELDGPTGDLEVDRAHDGAGVTYDCLLEAFGRDSYDGLGAPLLSYVHYGVDYQNAFFNGTQMVYGDGFAVPDVTTHEFAHGVTLNTAGLVYQNQSGAINEAMSDILAVYCENRASGAVPLASWQIGEQVPEIGPFRYMNNPTQDGISRDHVSELYVGEEDNGGVHLNSGIVNLAFVLLVDGGLHPRQMSPIEVVGVGLEDAAQVFYRALSVYMGPNTDLVAARAAVEQAAGDLFGSGSSEQISVSEAFAAVGVGGEPPERDVEPEPEPEPEPGDDDEPGDDGAVPNVTGGCSTTGGHGGALWLLGLLVAGLRRRRR